MKNSIIFDFNRTLYDPDAQALLPSARLVLQELHARGYNLFLVSRRENNREDLIQGTGIENYFTAIALLEEKTPEAILAFMQKNAVEKQNTIIVGDRVREEITAGNVLGVQTIWFQAGKFANEVPILEGEQPTFRITQLKDLLRIVP